MKRGLSLLSVVALLAMPAASAQAASSGTERAGVPNRYKVTRLVADRPGRAAQVDPNLVNAWGLVAGPSTPWWVADAETDVSTLYDGTGAVLPLVVKVAGGPTGAVFNGGASFIVSHHGATGPSLFMFATERGTIRGWDPNVPPPAPSTRAFRVVDGRDRDAIYKGLAIASTAAGDRLYATDFHNGRVDVFDGEFATVDVPGAFEDPDIPNGFAPFGIQSIGEDIFVTYAMQDVDAEDDVAGPGLGFVDRYNEEGVLLERVASEGELNAPWGLALAPSDFGRFSGDLLIGNFGDGRIHAYEPEADTSRMAGTSRPFKLEGTLRRRDGRILSIDGLWALQFGNGEAAGPTNSLFFTAGPAGEEHGLFGKIEAIG